MKGILWFCAELAGSESLDIRTGCPEFINDDAMSKTCHELLIYSSLAFHGVSQSKSRLSRLEFDVRLFVWQRRLLAQGGYQLI